MKDNINLLYDFSQSFDMKHKQNRGFRHPESRYLLTPISYDVSDPMYVLSSLSTHSITYSAVTAFKMVSSVAIQTTRLDQMTFRRSCGKAIKHLTSQSLSFFTRDS